MRDYDEYEDDWDEDAGPRWMKKRSAQALYQPALYTLTGRPMS